MTKPSNSYMLVFDDRPGYLYAHVRAETITRESAIEYLTRVAERRSETGARRILLLREIPAMLSDSDLFFTTRDFLEMVGSTRIAFVNPFADIDESMGFAMTIGVNRGANYRLFSSVTRAEEWLQRSAGAAQD